MPYKSDKLAIANEQLDQRVKLTQAEKAKIRHLYFDKQMPIRGIARIYEKICSRRTIQFVLFPERAQAVTNRAKELKRWEKYNRKAYHTPRVRKHRRYKYRLFKQGKLTRKAG